MNTRHPDRRVCNSPVSRSWTSFRKLRLPLSLLFLLLLHSYKKKMTQTEDSITIPFHKSIYGGPFIAVAQTSSMKLVASTGIARDLCTMMQAQKMANRQSSNSCPYCCTLCSTKRSGHTKTHMHGKDPEHTSYCLSKQLEDQIAASKYL